MKLGSTMLALAVGATVLFSAGTSHAKEFKLLHSWNPATDPNTAYILERFAPRIGEVIEGATIASFGPEAVPPFEQLEPTQAGVFDFLFTHTAYHFGTTRVAFGADAIKGNSAQRRDAGLWDEIDRQYNTVGVKLIAMIVTPGGFHMQLRDPLQDGMMKGRTIRATNVYRSVVEALGATNVVMPIGEVFTALERGAVDGGASPLIGSVSLGWNEVAPYIVRPRFGYSTTYLLMNLNGYNALEEKQKQALLALGKEIETGGDALMVELAEKEENMLKEAGSKVTEMAPAIVERLDSIWADGLFGLSAETNPEAAEAIRSLARKAGLTN